MLRTVGKLAGVILAALALSGSAPAAQIAYKRCADTNDFACGHLAVPLDPASGSGGMITLALRRHLAPLGGANDAVIALAGGPGQAALPFAEQFDRLLGPILNTRDLIVFDQRGTGSSQPLSCAAFEHLGGREVTAGAARICAEQIGQSRAFYTTADTVADIEAIRQAGGYEKLVLYGTSYGTKVAERYAQRYPSHVEALVLDSVVALNGPDPFRRSSFAAVRRVVRELCLKGACKHIARNPVADLAQLVKRLERKAMRSRQIDDHGVAHSVRVTPLDLLHVLYAGDFNPILRAELPAALRSADSGDSAPFARMLRRAESEEAEEEEPENLREGFDQPLYYATTCEEQRFPWRRTANPAARVREAAARILALPRRTFAPFTAADALADSNIPTCAGWPFASAAAEDSASPLPAVPTLILSGEGDLRTPTADARALARMIPGSQLLVVPDTGHSVLDSDPSSCADHALQAFFAGRPLGACRHRPLPRLLRPVPLAPRRLSDLPPVSGYAGRPGRTLRAVTVTFADLERQLTLAGVKLLSLDSPIALRTGGLRSGFASYSSRSLRLHHYSYVPGVVISGTITIGSAALRISGSAAAHGVLRLLGGQRLTGSLAGTAVNLAHFHANIATGSIAQAAKLARRR